MAKEIQIFTTREDFAALVAGLARDIAKDLHQSGQTTVRKTIIND